jgi:hypothetical protein
MADAACCGSDREVMPSKVVMRAKRADFSTAKSGSGDGLEPALYPAIRVR